MKNRRLMSVGIITILLFSLLANAKKIDPVVVERKAVVIEKMIERHNYIINGLTVCAFLQQLPVIVEGVGSLFNLSMKKKEQLTDPVIAEKLSFFSAMAQGFEHTFFTKEGWQHSWPIIAGWAATHFIIQTLQEKFQHPDTLRWYIRTHVPYVRTTQVIKSLSADLGKNNLSVAERSYKYDLLVKMCDKLTECGEDLCAYTQYKSSQFDGRQKISAESCSRYLLNYHNDILERIESALKNTTVEYQAIAALIDLYRGELMHCRAVFSAIENESEYDEKITS